ncbi:hypothetical protein AAFF_G00208420 [Aldrovandia affinis]|uniref:CRIB domain-containing protein n=1 Tax=Aldrovandia affinis TaxID=143900 RepID=A0AAD7RHC3_9TELE|nr:hypothetical protein AAFF_G00208420 [Aldrovandia affinis]
MSLGKLPGIKGLVSTSHRKRRFKKDLTADMISPPMGDFRHTMHVGRGGDVFGDTSFLSNHGGTGNGGAGVDPADSPANKTPSFFSRTLRHVRKTPPPARARPPPVSPPPPPVSPIVKNAISLPRLDGDAPNGNLKRALFPSSPGSPEDSTCTYGVQSGFVTLPRLSRSDRDCPGTCWSSEFRRSSNLDDGPLPLLHCDSITSFTVDLGPSLMSEVFGVIDSPNRSWGKEGKDEEEEEEESCTAQSHVTHSASAPTAGPPLREDMSAQGFRQRDHEWEEPEGETLRRVAPSAARVEPGMEPVRFKMAADVLARHYGGGGLSGGKQQTVGGDQRPLGPNATDSTGRPKRRGPCAYAEEEDEIKV